eukprot:Trichotokara_eunicae@DN1560_c0_g1_i1.p1
MNSFCCTVCLDCQSMSHWNNEDDNSSDNLSLWQVSGYSTELRDNYTIDDDEQSEAATPPPHFHEQSGGVEQHERSGLEEESGGYGHVADWRGTGGDGYNLLDWYLFNQHRPTPDCMVGFSCLHNDIVLRTLEPYGDFEKDLKPLEQGYYCRPGEIGLDEPTNSAVDPI